jgi:hypothetical protein
MLKNKKSKNIIIEKLHKILDNRSPRDLPSEDEKYLLSLKKRVKNTSVKETYYNNIVTKHKKEEDDSLKVKVVIHLREEITLKEKPTFKEKEISKIVEFKEKSIPEERIDLSLEDEEVFEVEKPEIEGQVFIEVKPIDIANAEKKAKAYEDLKEWESVEKIEREELPIEFEEPVRKDFKEVSAPKIEPEVKKEVETPLNYCHHCGAKMNGAGNFCGTCGKKLIVEWEEKKEVETPLNYCHHCGEKINGSGDFCGMCGQKIIVEVEKETESEPIKEVEHTSTIVSEEKEEEYASTWEAVEEVRIEEPTPEKEPIPTWEPVEEEKIEEPTPEKEPEPEEDIETKIQPFKDLKSIDQQTAILLYNNGITDIETLKTTPPKQITKIKGIKRKTTKQIKKELEELQKNQNIETEQIQIEETPQKPEETIPEEPTPEKEPGKKPKQKKKKIKKTAKKKKEISKKSDIPDKPEVAEIEKRKDVFKDINSIDEKIADLLMKNDINSIEKLQNIPIKELTKIKGIRRKVAKEIKKELKKYPISSKDETFENKISPIEEKIEEQEDEWDYYDEDQISDESLKEIKGFRHKDYTLFEKTIKVPSGKVRTVRFFSKAEPKDAEPIELPNGYEVKVNKKTGVPYLRGKKESKK